MDGCACLFAVLGLGLHAGSLDDWTYRGQALDNPVARAEIGYETRAGVEIVIEHSSQPRIVDTGLNVFMVRKRFNLTGK